MLKSSELTISGEVYTVKELTIGQLVPLIPRLTGDDASTAQLEMLKLAVYKDDQPLGEGVLELGVSCFATLMAKVMELNALGDDGDLGNE